MAARLTFDLDFCMCMGHYLHVDRLVLKVVAVVIVKGYLRHRAVLYELLVCKALYCVVYLVVRCTAGLYSSVPTGTLRVDFESSPNEHRVTDDVPADVSDDVTLVKLTPTTASVSSILFACLSVCLFVHALKGKRLELWKPNLIDL